MLCWYLLENVSYSSNTNHLWFMIQSCLHNFHLNGISNLLWVFSLDDKVKIFMFWCMPYFTNRLAQIFSSWKYILNDFVSNFRITETKVTNILKYNTQSCSQAKTEYQRLVCVRNLPKPFCWKLSIPFWDVVSWFSSALTCPFWSFYIL